MQKGEQFGRRRWELLAAEWPHTNLPRRASHYSVLRATNPQYAIPYEYRLGMEDIKMGPALRFGKAQASSVLSPIHRAAMKIVGRVRNGADAPPAFGILDAAQSHNLATYARHQFAQGVEYILIPSAPIDRDYAATLVSKAGRWLVGRNWGLFEPQHLFEDREWSVPIVSHQMLTPVLICVIGDASSLAEICELDYKTALNERSAFLQPEINDIYEIAYKHSRFYSYASILVSDECNMSCTMCMFHSQDDSYSFRRDRKSDRLKREITAEDVRRFIESLPSGKSILFSSAGELLRSARAMEYIEYARERGHPVAVGTNGSFLNAGIATRLIELKVDAVTFSVDGYTKEGYERVRVGGKWELLLRNIDSLVKLRNELKSSMKVTANCVLFDDLKQNQNELLDFWSQKVDLINLMTERIDYLGQPRPGAEFISPPKLEHSLCFAPFEGPQLLANGDISPC